MAEYTDNDLNRAAGIVEGLQSEDGRARRFDDLQEGLSIADVHANATTFFQELELVGYFDVGFPAVRLGDRGLVPVSLRESIGRGLPGIGFPLRDFPPDFWYRLVYDALRDRRERFGEVTLSPSEARNTFITRASEFLATRLAALRSFGAGGTPPGPPPSVLTLPKYVGGPPTKVSGCLFQVHSNTSGLTAHWSGAYYIAWNYHGAPTTPAKGTLQAGTYVFGVSGGAYTSVQYDPNSVCTLPGTPSVHLQY